MQTLFKVIFSIIIVVIGLAILGGLLVVTGGPIGFLGILIFMSLVWRVYDSCFGNSSSPPPVKTS